MNRYMTTTSECGLIEAWTESDNWRDAQDLAVDFVWQFANNPTDAIANHDTKLDQWVNDVNTGRTPKETY